MIESGFPDVVFAPWYAMYAPAGTPPAIVNRLNSEVEKILALPEVKAKHGLPFASAGQGG